SAVRRRKTVARRLAIGEPAPVRVLVRIEPWGHARGQAQAEQVFGVVRDARRIARAPARVDLVDVLELPFAQGAGERAALAAVDAGLLGHFARGGQRQGLVDRVLAAGDRLQ